MCEKKDWCLIVTVTKYYSKPIKCGPKDELRWFGKCYDHNVFTNHILKIFVLRGFGIKWPTEADIN